LIKMPAELVIRATTAAPSLRAAAGVPQRDAAISNEADADNLAETET
jgi:hypothetical protein